MTYKFNRDYNDHEQVAQYLPAFMATFAEIDPCLRFAYNDQFRGRVPGIEGPDEDNAIYMLQNLKRLRELDDRIAAAIAEGCRPIESVDETTKFARVIHYGFYMGGTGWQEWADARITAADGFARLAILPKGKRTHGHFLTGKVLAR